MRKTATIIFDFDGTLHDCMAIYPKALQMGYDWLVERGEAPARQLDEADMMANIGLTVREAWGRMCPDIPWSVSCHAAARVGECMDYLIETGEARLYPGVPEMLSRVKEAGHTLVFLSNCRNTYCDAVRASFGFDEWFGSRYYTAEQYGEAPKERIFEIIRSDVPGPYIAVGDRYKDLALARAHDLPSIGCLYGYGSAEELSGATYLVDDPAEIPAIIDGICKK